VSVDPLNELIDRLNEGDIRAAEQAFIAYEPYLRMVVRRLLSGPLRSKLDSVDVVQSVWADLLGSFRAAGWRFTDLTQLRAFLVKVTRNRLIDRHRQHASALQRERALTQTASRELPLAPDPRPSEIAQGNELWQRMLEQCSPAHREIVMLKRQGLLLSEIAARTGLHEGSIRRILYDLAHRLSVSRTTAARSSDAVRPGN
jgi:RNA polymerase sigma-70 factor (ECF subfamily)